MGWPNIDAGDAPSLVIISACRRGLVGGDKKTSPVQLIHFLSFGVHYLRAPPDPFGSVHLTITETYSIYLNYD